MPLPQKISSAILLISILLISHDVIAQNSSWKHLFTDVGDLPLPWKSTEQTGALVADFDNDGLNDFVLTCRKQAPAIVWYQRNKSGWTKFIVEDQMLNIEAGGVAYDVDGDGDLDIVFGGDWQSSNVWWWENPYPQMNFKWKRHVIKSEGATQHHDQVIGRFRHDEQTQLVFWNQGSRTLYLADLPADPKKDNWEYRSIYTAGAADEKHGSYVEGLTSGDVDGDGYVDIIAGDHWFKYDPSSKAFTPVRYAEAAGRVAAGKLKPGKTLQIVVSPGDGTGPVKWYEYTGNPTDEHAWVGHDLAGRDLIHGHSLQVADIDGDGNNDIFVAEMMKWADGKQGNDNPNAESFIFYGDGNGKFTKSVFQQKMEFHEARAADLDGDGDIDILSKPYNWRTPRIDVWLQNGTGSRIPSLSKIIPGKIGLELYSFRREMAANLEGTLKEIKKMGFDEVEGGGTYGLTPAGFKDLLKKNGLKATSLLFGFNDFRDSLDKIISMAKVFGASEVGCAWIPHDGAFKKEDADKAITLFNEAGRKLKEKGLHFIYHPHGYEFAPGAGGTLFDYLAKNTQKGIADFEMDVFWAYHGGADPVLLLKKYPGRFTALHLKQMREGEPTGIFTGSAPDESSVSLGKGVIDFKVLLQTAIQTGVQYYFIEDEAVNAVAQVKESLLYLEMLKKKN